MSIETKTRPPVAAAFEYFYKTPAQRDACFAALVRVRDEVRGCYASVLATIDGKPIVHAAAPEWRAGRVAAIVGSLCALGETLCKEIGQRGFRDVLIETEVGLSVVQRLPDPASRLILLTASTTETNLGVLLTYTRTCAQSLARLTAAAAA
jgi:uncharacterized protein